MIFEPDNDNLALLYKTLKKNKFNNFFIFPFAVSEKTSIKKFLVDNVTGFNGSLLGQSNIPQQKLELNEFKKTIRVDGYCHLIGIYKEIRRNKNKYPIYVISKGRYETNYTVKCLNEYNLKYHSKKEKKLKYKVKTIFIFNK